MRVLLVLFALFLAACASAAQPPRTPSISDARAVCRAVAEGRVAFLNVAGNQDGRNYEGGWTQLDVDNDGRVDDVAVVSAGSSATPGIQVRGHPYGGYLDSQYDYDAGSYGPWSGQLELVRHRGLVYEVFYSDGATHDFPVYVAIHLPNDTARWVCGFESAAPVPPLTPVRPDAASICAAVEQRFSSTAEDFPFTPVEETSSAPGELIVARGDVDFMNDGAPRALRLMEYESGAGAGCGATYYDLSNPQGSEDDLLAELQRNEDGRLPTCHGNVARFHRINGVVVFEQRFLNARPQGRDQQFWWVSRVENGRAVRLCEVEHFAVTPRTIKYNSAFYPQPG